MTQRPASIRAICLGLGLLGCIDVSFAADEGSVRTVIPAIPVGRLVDTNTMQRIYDLVKAPFKYGVILKCDSKDELVDCPSVFRHNERWYMIYVTISNKIGYQTFLAQSDDLLRWQKLGKILSFSKTNEWDGVVYHFYCAVGSEGRVLALATSKDLK
jgi:hypothetical protein